MFLLQPSVFQITVCTSLKWVDKFTYLSIRISGRTKEYVENNIQPLMSQLMAKCAAWSSLPLTLVGRVNLLKNNLSAKIPVPLPKNTPAHIPKTFFRRLEGLLISFVWARKPHRVAKQILYLPMSGGGLALRNYQLYYWVAVLVTVGRWFFQLR